MSDDLSKEKKVKFDTKGLRVQDILAGTDPVGAPKTPHVEAEKERIVAVNTALRTGPSPWVFIVIVAIVFGIIGGGGYYWRSLSSGNIPVW